MPSTMRAAVIDRHGGSEVVTVRHLPIPTPGAHEVRLRVRAAALNRADLGLMRGLTGPGIRPKRLPMTPGIDVAGEIDAVGDAVTTYRTGDRVVVYPGIFCGACRWCHAGEESMCDHYEILGEERPGGFAEYVVVPAANLERLPAGVTWERAAAVPAAFTTAWRMLITGAALTAGDTLLVTGIGGGVSTAAAALAQRVGARVLATTRDSRKAEAALALGVAAVHVGYDEPIDAWVRTHTNGVGVDVVADSIGAATWRSAIRSLRKGGTMVICGASSGDDPSFSIRELYQQHRRVIGAPLGNRRDFTRAMRIAFEPETRVVIDRVIALDDVRSAFDRLQDGAQFGKIVVVP
jgi:NADPH:quinone reductase-like Zn-dependent oxidoreductase